MSDKTQPLVALEDRVSFGKKLAYALGGPVDILSVWILVSLAYQIFNMELGLAPTKVAIILMMLRLWDGVADPVMGWISDNTRTRWGRRRPYILIGGILTGLCFPLLWWFPTSYGLPENHNHLMTWVIGFGILFYTSFTIWAMPYQSLLMEMTPDYNERTRVTSVRSILQSLASFFVGCSWWVALRFKGVDGDPSAAIGMRTISLYIGAVILVLGVLPAFFVKERYYESNLTKNMEHTDVRTFLKDLVLNNKLISGGIVLLLALLVWQFHAVLEILSVHPFYILPFFFLLLLLGNVREALKNRPFRVLSLFTVLFLIGTSIFDSYGRYVGTYYVLGGDKDISSIYQILGTTAYMMCSLIMIPVFRRISEKIGKPKTLGISVVLVLFSAFLTWFTFNPAYPLLQLVNTMFIGAGYAGLWLMIPSMQIDVVDDDELASGSRREGTFASVFSWILKLSFCFGFLASGPLIEYAGFNWSVTNQAGWFNAWVSSVQEGGEAYDIGYVELVEPEIPAGATNEGFNGFQIAFVQLKGADGVADGQQARAVFGQNRTPRAGQSIEVVSIGLSADPADNIQPATGYKNMMGIDEDDSLNDLRVGYVALVANASETFVEQTVEEGRLKRFIRNISTGRVRPDGYDFNTWCAYTVLSKGQDVPTDANILAKEGKLARIVVAKPMPNMAMAALARLDTNQPPSVYRNMRVGYVALPAVALIVALVLLFFFPINAAKASEIRGQLEERRGKV